MNYTLFISSNQEKLSFHEVIRDQDLAQKTVSRQLGKALDSIKHL